MIQIQNTGIVHLDALAVTVQNAFAASQELRLVGIQRSVHVKDFRRLLSGCKIGCNHLFIALFRLHNLIEIRISARGRHRRRHVRPGFHMLADQVFHILYGPERRRDVQIHHHIIGFLLPLFHADKAVLNHGDLADGIPGEAFVSFDPVNRAHRVSLHHIQKCY